MKKLWSVSLLGLILFLAACGSNETETTNDSGDDTPTEENDSTVTEDDSEDGQPFRNTI